MNLTSILTLPLRLGYEATRRTLDLAAGAGRAVGLFGGDEQPVAEERPERRRPARPKAGMDDATLARKVESEIFRVRGVAKGKIDVNAADGVVWLRGEAKTPELIKRIEQRASAVPEVLRVENLLHPPKTPAPTRSDTPPSQRRTRRASERRTARDTKAKVARGGAGARRKGAPPKRTTAERPAAPAEPAPGRLAARGEGRRPAPLGSSPESVEVPDDVTLARQVESAIFGDGGAEKGAVDVNAAGGTVWLRGTARNPEQVRELKRRALEVPGVGQVESLLHLPGTPAPTAAEPAVDPAERPITARRFSAEERRDEDERRQGDGEPLPSEVAERGEGRQPAPLGAGDDAPGGGSGDVRGSIP